MADTVTLLDFPQVTTVEDGDLIYLIRGTGTDRDKVLPGSVLKAYLGETLLSVTETGSINLSDYTTNVLIVADPMADIALTITGALPGGNKCIVVNKSAHNVTLSIISTSPVVPSGEYIEYYSDGSAMNLLTGSYVMKQWVLDYLYPVGKEYAQYPVIGSNTEADAFPVANRPATRFGGTWTEIFTSDDAFFKVGTTDHQTRTDGLSPDQMQRITGGDNNLFFVLTQAGAYPSSDGALRATNNTLQAGSGGAYGQIRLKFDSYFSPNARTSATTSGVTEPRNYRMKIWKRTA